jgi:hypothetical protein
MPIPDTPYARALRYQDLLIAFVCAPLPQPESSAPAWLTTAEGQRYMQAMTRGAVEEAMRIFDAASTQNTYDILNHAWDDLAPTPPEEHAHG